MLKFRCQHCGQRVAVPSRNLGKLVTCSECGMQTHPLAEQIAAAGPNAAAGNAPPRAVAAASTTTPGPCDNCGAPIGRLQTAHPWNGHVVCGGCFQRLAGESGGSAWVAAQAAPVVGPIAAPQAATVVTRARNDVASHSATVPGPKPVVLEIRERVLRALIVFVVASVALYGALSLLRDIAGLIAVAAVAVIALLALYAVFRGSIAARRRGAPTTELAPLRDLPAPR